MEIQYLRLREDAGKKKDSASLAIPSITIPSTTMTLSGQGRCRHAANRVPAPRVLSTNIYDNKDSHLTSGLFPPTSDTPRTVPGATPPCHIPPTNQKTLSHQGPSTSGHI
ncbi:hypothetical protein TNCV_3934001 [Trichonephila clavipes]|nr:hypothetical protein TNCV_3934001 [Trichonephila clavipes]